MQKDCILITLGQSDYNLKTRVSCYLNSGTETALFPRLKNKSFVMAIRQIEFKEETIQTLRIVKKIMAAEWLKHRMEVDELIRRVRSNSFHASKV